MNTNFGTINPVTLNVPQVGYTTEPIKLPDIVGLYQASRTQTLENQKTQAEGEYRRAQAQAEQAKVPLTQQQTKNTTQEGLLKKYEPVFNIVKEMANKGEFAIASGILNNLYKNEEAKPFVEASIGVPFITEHGDLIETIVEGPNGNLISTVIDKETGNIKFRTNLEGAQPGTAIAKANAAEKEAVYNTEQLQKQTEQEKQESRDRRDAIDKSVKLFTDSAVYKAAAESMISIDGVGSLAKEALTNPAATSQLTLAIARIAQSGILTDKDITRILPDPSIQGRLSTVVNILSAGGYSVSDVENYVKLAKAMKNGIATSLVRKHESWLDETSKKLEASKFKNSSKDEIRAETSTMLTNVLGNYAPPAQQSNSGNQSPTSNKQTGFSSSAINALNKRAGKK